MSAEFIRTRLFQPFVSTKDNGFGIGAYEARALVDAMGGRLEVESVVGEGHPLHHFPAGRGDPLRAPLLNGCAHERAGANPSC